MRRVRVNVEVETSSLHATGQMQFTGGVPDPIHREMRIYANLGYRRRTQDCNASTRPQPVRDVMAFRKPAGVNSPARSGTRQITCSSRKGTPYRFCRASTRLQIRSRASVGSPCEGPPGRGGRLGGSRRRASPPRGLPRGDPPL
jgi:hypothetical protein